MKILVVGLGLIGGSICKALKKYTSHFVTGCDLKHDIEFSALRDVAIDKEFDGSFDGYDVIIVSLFPDAAERYLRENIEKFDKKTLITDVCGIKGSFSMRVKKMTEDCGLRYIGIHPMAGKEFGGYNNSCADLFQKANFIIAPFENSKTEDIDLLTNLCLLYAADPADEL